MKKIIIAAILFSSFIFTSCGDEIKDLLDVDLKSTVTHTIPMEIAAGTKTVTTDSNVELKNNPDFAKYINKLKGLEITKMTFKITNLSGDQKASLQADFKWGNFTLYALPSSVIASEVDKVIEVKDAKALQELAASFLKAKTFPIKVTGTSTADQKTTFDVIVSLDVKVKASPLK